jgi:hypothetical protein
VKINFKCPECKDSTRIEEVMVGVAILSEIVDIDVDGIVDYGHQSEEGGEISAYNCLYCGFKIANNGEGLYEYLKSNNMLQEDK